ncbi:MAG: hypothetical protein NWS63_00815 [Saprospiraceae bacterium]|jgi:uncharacterized protein|nr:hypothetical protein [Saprospiraceae bacterium]
MLVISDTSPITNLIRIGQLELLKVLFEEVVIPQKVYEELNYQFMNIIKKRSTAEVGL